MSKANIKSKLFLKSRKLQFSRICRSCLNENVQLKELFSTRLPFMIQSFSKIQVSENDELPSKVCASCFRQIIKFYAFKKSLERNDRILRLHLKQSKLKNSEKTQDILDNVGNDGEENVKEKNLIKIEDLVCDVQNNSGNTAISESKGVKDPIESVSRLRKSQLQANKLIDDVNETKAEVCDDNCDNKRSNKEQQNHNLSNFGTNNANPFKDEPPPLIPLASTKIESEHINTSSITDLPRNTPPLVPIKPLASLNPATIVNALSNSIEDPVQLKLRCSICNEEFYSIVELKNHRLYQCQYTGMQCNICKKEFSDTNRLIRHLKGHMISKDYECKICRKRYPNPSTFRVHLRTHTGERPFKCQTCNKGFVRWAGVVGHMKTHTSNKPFKCQSCGKGFKISSNLERHKVLHTGILPFCCSYCGKKFSQSDNLQLHIRTYHTYERPYLCNECGKRFVSSTRLKRHMWVHTGYKPYGCRHCSKTYSNSNDCKTHEKQHTGGNSAVDKPHTCNSCNKRFSHPCRLAKHMKTHERPFPCTECGKSFTSASFLRKHKSHNHEPDFIEHVSMPLSVEEVYVGYN